ncbi:uncharacterized protein F4812DRAFT_439954 [Daldinia caldariorum]|uniref:uncharacterized protein n=1 Tax=Daldinia caldariorum TaxID=326644 RepID=UPI002007793C|nr:uncharacterized protein F4812DRAFT_439954 [Daldinia caldariorum]KAI1465182.1 hypothetical protein F4812DRAFT_439954 [Daldinia caldariorum]
MAPGQNTFSIIPDAPCAFNGGLDAPQARPSKRPMTSKQAKKAYQKTNKAPKLSKAEQRRQELFEQDRIRREFEKERNQARARAAREKKKEKEEKERAEKKKKGLPLVDVRPSQATIAWFVRGDKKKNPENQKGINSPVADHHESHDSHESDESGDCNSGTLSGEDEPEPPPKKQKTVPLDTEHSPSSAGIPNCSASSLQDLDSRGTSQVASSAAESLVPEPQIVEHLTVDADNLATMVLPDELFDEPVDAVGNSPKNDDADLDVDFLPHEEEIIPDSPSQPKYLDHRSSPVTTKEFLPGQNAKESTLPPADRLPLQNLGPSKVNSRVTNAPQELGLDQAKPVYHTPSPAPDPSIRVSESIQPSTSQSKSFQQPKIPMGPPAIPPRFRSRGHFSAVNPRTPSFLPKAHASGYCPAPNPNLSRSHRVPQRSQEEQPPTSTQLFMLGHLDDLFPSPSQEVKEIFGESKSNIRGNDRKLESKAAYTSKSPTARNLPRKSISAVSNQNYFGSATKNGQTEDGKYPSSIQTRGSPLLPTANIHSSGDFESFDMPFFSTQDFLLSSQDLEDLGGGETSSSGLKLRDRRGSYNSTSENPVPNDRIDSTALSYPSTQEQSSGSKPQGQTGLEGDRSQSSHFRPVSEATGLGSSKAVCEETTALNTPTESSRSHSGGFKNNIQLQKKACDMLQVEKNMAPLRASPKPFFTSSRREVHRIYTKERIKTIAWESASTRRNVQDELKRLQRSEDEKSKWSTPARATGGENENSSKPNVSSLASRPQDQVKDQSRPQSINQLSSSAGGIPNQKKGDSIEPRPRLNQSRSPYEKMLELLEHTESHKQKQQEITASQETDYGEAGLDEVLNEML